MATSDEFPPTGYQDDRTGDQVQHSVIDEQVTVKKKGSKLPLIIFSVFILVALLVVGYMMFKPAPAPAPKPRPAPVEQAEPAKDPAAPAEGENLLGEADPNATAPVDPNQPAIDPATGLPVTQPATAQPAIDPATGLPVTQPAANQPAIDPATGLPVTQPAQPAVDPATGLPVAQPAPAQPAPAQPAPAQPAPQPAQVAPTQPAAVVVQPAPVVVQPAPVVVQSAQPAADPLAVAPQATPEVVTQEAPVTDANDPLAQFRTLLAPIDSRVTALEKKVGKLVRDVTNIQSWMKGNSASAPKARTASRPANTVRLQQRDPYDGRPVSPPVSRVIIEDGAVRSVNNEATVAPARPAYDAMTSCNVQAIVQGRVWIKRADGSFVSYGEGDAWTNGRVINQIDPARGVLVDGQWMCM